MSDNVVKREKGERGNIKGEEGRSSWRENARDNLCNEGERGRERERERGGAIERGGGRGREGRGIKTERPKFRSET